MDVLKFKVETGMQFTLPLPVQTILRQLIRGVTSFEEEGTPIHLLRVNEVQLYAVIVLLMEQLLELEHLMS